MILKLYNIYPSKDLGNKTKTETDTFLEFFEEATMEELTAMPGCSKKKAEVSVCVYVCVCCEFNNVSILIK